MDDRIGAFVVLEAMRLIARKKIDCAVYCVTTVQEEIGLRGATTAAYSCEPHVGIAVDVYHVWWDPELEREIRRAGKQRILAFHVCDWLVPTADLLLDRGMMGDGVIDIRRIRGWVEAVGYDGFAEVEIFSANNWWKRDPEEVVRVCAERHRSVC